MQIAYAGVSPDQQSLPWAPGMGGTAAPAGTLAGAPAGGLDFLTALLARTTMPEARACAPIHHHARTPVVGLAQALASADASCPSLSFAGFGDAAHTTPAPPGEVALDPPPAARVDEKRALLAGALAILPAPWTLPVLPASLSAAPASEVATPQVEVSAREKLLALIAMAQGVTSSVTPPVGPGGSRFAQTSPLIQATFAATSDFEQGQTVAPQTEGLLATQDLPAGEPSPAASAVFRPPIATVSPSSAAPQPSLVSPEAPEARAVPIPSAIAMSTTVQAAPTAQPAPAHRDALAADLVNAPLRQSVALPDLPPGERVVLEAAPTRPQPMAPDVGLEQAPRASSSFPYHAAAPAQIAAVAAESPAPVPALEIQSAAGERGRASLQSDLAATVAAPARMPVDATSADADRIPPERAAAWSTDLRGQGAQPADPNATPVVSAPRPDAPNVPASVAVASPMTPRAPEGGRLQARSTFAVPASQGVQPAAEGPVVFDLTSPGADFVTPAVAAAVDAPTLASPADPERLTKVEPAPVRAEQSLPPSSPSSPSSPMMSRAAEGTPATSEPRPVVVEPAPDRAEQSLPPSSPSSLTMSRATEGTPATSEPRPVVVEPAPDRAEQSLPPSSPSSPSSPMMNRAAEGTPATSGPRPVVVEPAPDRAEQSLPPSSPSSPMMSRAAEGTPATSEPRPVRVDPTLISAEQPSLSSWTGLRPGQTTEVVATSTSPRSEAPAAAQADVAVPNEPRRVGEGVQLAGTPDPSRWTTGPRLAPDVARPAADTLTAASPGFAATMVNGPRANEETHPDPASVVREQALPDGRPSYGPIAADRPGRSEPTLAVTADGSVRKEERPLPAPTSSVHQPTVDVVASSIAERAPLSAAQRLAREAYLASQGEPSAHVRSAAPVAMTDLVTRTIAAPSVAQWSLVGPQEGNRPSDLAPAALPAVDRQPGSLPAASPAADRQPDPAMAASPALPISSSSAMRPELMASWRPAPGPMPPTAREEHESSPLRRASGQPASTGVRLETTIQPYTADLAPASAPAVDRLSSRPLAQPADGPAPREISAQPPVAGVVSVPAPREGPSVVTKAAADPAFEAEASEGFQELLDRIQIAVRRDESTWKLQLRPPSLGHLEVHLTTGAKGLEIVMRTETAEAQAFLQANLPELSRGLDQRGVVVERCEVTCGQPGADLPGAPGEGRQQAGAAWQFVQPAVSLPAPPARRNTAPTKSNAGVHSRSLVDVQA